MNDSGRSTDSYAQRLECELVTRYGYLLPSTVLAEVLGYTSRSAYAKAVELKRVPVRLLRLPNRRGHFALAKDVATWLSTLSSADEAHACDELAAASCARVPAVEAKPEAYRKENGM